MILALDLERTLISDAMNCEPRPGVLSFLEFCAPRFARICLFSAVSPGRSRAVLAALAEQGHVPHSLLQRLEYVEWDGDYKDLAWVSPRWREVLLVDDDEGWVLPEQRTQWIGVEPWDPYMVRGEDRELERVCGELERRLREAR